MIVRVVMLSAIFLAGASASATAEISDGGRLGIGQGANSCWAWTRSQEAKASAQGLYAQWVAGFVSGVNWDTDEPDILAEMDVDRVVAWVDSYCKAATLSRKSPRAPPCSFKSYAHDPTGGMGLETVNHRREMI